MKGVQCYELFGGIALKNHAFSFFNFHGDVKWCLCRYKVLIVDFTKQVYMAKIMYDYFVDIIDII